MAEIDTMAGNPKARIDLNRVILAGAIAEDNALGLTLLRTTNFLEALLAQRDAAVARAEGAEEGLSTAKQHLDVALGQIPQLIADVVAMRVERDAAEKENESLRSGNAQEFRAAVERSCDEAIGRYKHEARDALARVAKLEGEVARNEWRPIESAPKDGTSIVICGHAWGKPDGELIFNVFHWNPSRDCWITGNSDSWTPTHWRPLPAPPTRKET